MSLFRSRRQQRADAMQQQLRSTTTAATTSFNCAASLEGLVEASSSTVSLSASGLCRCGLGGEEVHSVQVRLEEKEEKESTQRESIFHRERCRALFSFIDSVLNALSFSLLLLL